MPRLLLLRHAKSAWSEPGLADSDRPLAPRGRRAAALMAEAIAAGDYRPDRILCSPSRRTRETLAALIPHLGDDVRIAITPELYEPMSGDYREAIAVHGEDAECLLVIGHNPATQATAVLLIGGGDPSLAAAIAEKFPTAALAAIDFGAKGWAELRPHSGRVVAFLTPRAVAKGEDVGDD